MTLLIQHCPACRRYQYHPRPLCAGCGNPDLWSVEAAGTGTVDSFTTVHRADVPYTVARVRLTEGPIVLTHLIGIPEPRCDQPVRLTWHEGLAVFTSE
ncbi:hypothetical protein ACTI_81590 [Actinoplanes sp. OR16]|uniref:Zn-ribbon domain-containing OB-fold protein n=1 Tax=Actinoplanes sp. OR16 TaxID=946334 RepID=UPI000F6F45DC|nr:OB-fold domain-containing protein [Actinoplanes sp. OR16]BBH71474.1 hypothetical protein ACTI_81590 [Actinoplanes sp. OR16]